MSAFATRLREESACRYHDRHPFHVAMHEGRLTPEQLRGWVTNRYYYQTRIPLKDALILAKSEDPAFRRVWIHRIHDHDDEGGGLALWERLGEAVGIPRPELVSHARVLPRTRAACDAYVELVRGAPLVVAVASSLTEQLAPDLMQRRIEAWERHYPWVTRAGLDYFRARVTRARHDGEEALAFVEANATTTDVQDRCVAALVRKTEILWELLDAVQAAYGIGAGAERPRLAARARIRHDRARSATFVMAPDRGVRLSESAERIVRLCDGSRTLSEIVAALAEENRDTDPEAIERDVQALIRSLVDRRVIEVGP